MLTGPALGAAIEAARKKKAVTKKALADHFGVEPPSVQDWVNRGTIAKEKLPELWRYFADVVGPEHWGLTPGWTDTQPANEGPRDAGAPALQAHQLSHTTETFPPTITWEQLAMPATLLPDEFQLVLIDDAMAPLAPAGVRVKFDRRRAPVPGDAVLLRDAAGRVHLREYRPRLDGTWEAHAANPAYPSLVSSTPALEVLGVFTGIDTSWAALARRWPG